MSAISRSALLEGLIKVLLMAVKWVIITHFSFHIQCNGMLSRGQTSSSNVTFQYNCHMNNPIAVVLLLFMLVCSCSGTYLCGIAKLISLIDSPVTCKPNSSSTHTTLAPIMHHTEKVYCYSAITLVSNRFIVVTSNQYGSAPQCRSWKRLESVSPPGGFQVRLMSLSLVVDAPVRG